MKRVLRQCLAGLLSVVLAFTLLPSAALAEEADGATGQTAVEQVQALIDALPDAEEITDNNRADVQAQIDAIDAAILGLTGDEAATLDTSRYDAAVAALSALDAQTADPEPGAVEQVQALIDALPDAEEITADNRADVQAQIDAIDAAMLELTEDQAAALDTTRYDAAVAALSALDTQTADPDPEPGAVEQVQALIDALPDAEEITADNRADVEAQLTAIDEAKQDLTDDELDTLDITRYMAAVEAILALDNMAGANKPETMDAEFDVSRTPVNINTNGNYTITGSTASNAITVTDGTVTITLNGVSVTSSSGCAFDIQKGDVTLILSDGSVNSFTSAGNYAGIHVAEGASLTIRGTGALNAVSQYRGAGIGGNQGSGAGHITIESGTITAKSNGDGAGIGGGHTSEGSSTGGTFQSITITGGKVTAESGGNGAGIGNGCWGKTLGTISISGGIIHAKTAASAPKKPISGDKAYDIGYSHSGSQSGGTISITGGVIFPENRGIKGHSYSNCLVVPKNGEITVYGNPTIKEDFTIPSGRTLTVPNGRTLTVAPGATLTVVSGATLTNNGTVQNNGRIVNNGTISGDIRGNSPVGYSISVTAIVFDSVQEGYEQPEAKPITIKNTGTGTVTISKVTVSGSDFTIINGSENTVAVGGSNTSWTIQPRSGLAAGKHTATITVTYDGGRNATTTVSFQVDNVHIKYLDANGREATCKVYTEVTGQTSTWNTGWYVVSGEQSISGWITVNGNVNLILTNDSVLTSKSNGVGDKGIVVTKGNSLTIYAQPPGTGSVGKISTAGSLYVAGIGGSSGSAGTITIHGGQITASGGGNAAAIGSSSGWSLVKNGAIVITGGVVNANNSNYSGDIAYTRENTSYDTFSTGTAGNAVIFADKIGDHSNETKWSGIIFEGNTGKIYGTPTPIFSFEIPSNKTLNVEKDHPLHIAKGVTMTNKGTINIGTESDMNAVLNNEGTIINEGTIDVWGQLTNGEIGIQNQGNGKIVYHFNLDIETPTFDEAEYGYSQPLPKEITITNNGEMDATITDVKLEGDDFTLNNGNKTALTKGTSDTSWTIQPKANLSVGPHTATISVTYSGSGGTSRTATAEVTFTVIKAESDITAPEVTATYGESITLKAEVKGSGVSGISLMGVPAEDKVQFSFPKGESREVDVTYTDPDRKDSGTAEITIEADKVKEYLEPGENEVTVSYGGSGSLNPKDSVKMTVTVNPKTLTFDFTANERAYDQTTDVTGSFTLNGVVDGDNVTASYVATAESKNVGEAVGVDVSFTLDGADKDYYTVEDPTGVTVKITQAELDLTVPAVSITYGTKLTNDLLSGTAKIKDTGKSVDGSWAWDVPIQDAMPTVSDSERTYYKVVFTPSPEASTNFTEASLSKEITITVGKATSQVTVDTVSGTYGESITITANVSAYGVEASFVTGEVEFTDGGTTLGTAEVKSGVATLTISGSERNKQHALFGASGSSTVTAEYSGDSNINEGSDDAAVSITPKALTYTVTATGKVYDGDAAVEVQLDPVNLVPGDSVTLTAIGSLSSVDANTYHQVNLSNIAQGESDDAKYYSVEKITVENATIQDGVTISPKAVELVWKLDDGEMFTVSYDGKPHTATAAVNNKALEGDEVEVTVVVKPDSGAGTGSYNATATDAGNYTATAELTGTAKDNYTLMGCATATQAITISKVLATCTAPTANEDLTYTGEAQQLVTAGTPAGGTMMYALGENGSTEPGDEAFDSDIPSGTDAKTYYVWYYVQGDGNHDDSAKKCVEVSIAKAEVTFSVSDDSHTYDGTAKKVTLTNSNTSGAPLLVETSGYTVTYGVDKTDSKTDVGEYEIHITLTSGATKNYKFAGQGDGVTELMVEGTKLSIGKATSRVSDVTITGAGEGLTYGDTFTVSAKVNAPDTMTGTVTFKAGETVLGVANSHVGGVWTIMVDSDEKEKQHAIFDNTEITAEYSGDDNIDGSSGSNDDVTVAKKSLTYTVTATGRVWDGTTGVEVALEATNTVTGDTVTLTAKGDLDNAGEAGTYTKVNLSDVKIDGRDKDYYTTEPQRNDADLTAEIQITKHDSSVTAPAGKSGLTYTGEPLILIDAATGVDGGTAKYYVGETAPDDGVADWQTDVSKITGLNAGEYTVWYYADGDENHNDTPVESIKVTIGKGEGQGSVTMKDYFCMQTGVDPEPVSDTNGTANVTYTYTVKGQNDYKDTKPTTAGEYTVKAVFAETDNYNAVTATADFTISHLFNEGWAEESDGYHHTCPCNTDVRLQETEFNAVPDGLKDNEALDTVEKITQVLVEEVKKGDSIPENNTAVYDVRLQVKSGGSDWVDVTGENFPEDGITVILPYPEGTDSSYTFTVIHMITTGENAGQMEKLEPTNGEDGISFTVNSLSPICVGWTAPPSSDSYYYNVAIPSDFEGGSVTTDRPWAQRGNKITLTVKPDEGHHFGSITVTNRNGKSVELTDNGDGTYAFIMPYGKVTVEAEFVKCSSLDFTDLDTKAWYHDYTDYVIAHGLMNGIGGGLFEPGGTVNRAQMVMVLWNMSDKPVVNYYMTYSDVSEEAWYAEAIRWATSEGIVAGYGGGLFGPGDPITREQMAAMIYRYEQKYGDGGFTGDWMYRLPFADLDQISDWAFEAVAWCNMKGVITGKGNSVFDPKGLAKRSEIAAILTRYCGEETGEE